MMYEHILFDLDGTLTESGPGIIHSVQYALQSFGIDELDHAKLERFVGPPLLDSFSQFYGFSPDMARTALHRYREYYESTGIFQNSVYAGIPALLDKLAAAGKKMYVATSKPENYAHQILEHFKLSSRFIFIGGSDMEETRVRKDEIIRYVLDKNGLSDGEKDSVVMVGDRHHDIEGAARNGIRSVGVLYGYGSREELVSAGADSVAATVDALFPVLCAVR
jgi:phosphoglycolate phosphatase